MNDMVKEAPPKPRAAQPTLGGSVYVKPQDIQWSPTQFEGISIWCSTKTRKRAR